MKSSFMKAMTAFYVVFGLLGSVVSAIQLSKMPEPANKFTATIVVTGVISTIIITLVLAAIAKILENTEKNNQMLTELLNQRGDNSAPPKASSAKSAPQKQDGKK